MKKIQFGAEIMVPVKNSGGYMILNYYLLESPVGFGYSELKSYGIEILRTDRYPGCQDMSECKQIEGIFFDVEEAISFIAKIKKENIKPTDLAIRLEEYIKEKVRIQRENSVYNKTVG